MVVSQKTDLRFPVTGQQGHGHRIIHSIPEEQEREVFTSEFAKKMQSGCAKGRGEKGKSRFWDSGSGKRLA